MRRKSKILLVITGIITIIVIGCFINRFWDVKYSLEHEPLNSNPEVYQYTKVSQIEKVISENYDLITDTIEDIWNEPEMYYDIFLFNIDECLSRPDFDNYEIVKKYEVRLREIRNVTNMDFLNIDKYTGKVHLFQHYIDGMEISLEAVFDANNNWEYEVVNKTKVKNTMVKLYDLIYNKHF